MDIQNDNKPEFRTLQAALDVLKQSTNREMRALGFLIEHQLEEECDLDEDLFEDEDEAEELTPDTDDTDGRDAARRGNWFTRLLGL